MKPPLRGFFLLKETRRKQVHTGDVFVPGRTVVSYKPLTEINRCFQPWLQNWKWKKFGCLLQNS